MKRHKYKIGVRLKVTVFICVVALLFIAIAIWAGYRYSFGSLGRTAGENYRHMAQLMANSVGESIDKELGLIKANAASDILINAVKESNSKYKTDEKSIQRYLMDMDKKWIEAPDDHPLIKEYLENRSSLNLRSFKEEEGKKIETILVTDRFGGLVAASSRTSDFYQGGKDWWKDAFDAGAGKILARDIVFDESTGAWALPLAVPMRDESGKVIGIYRALINITTFFGPLENFRVGKTGNAALVDDKAYLVFYPNTKPFTNKFCEYSELQKVLQSEKRWGNVNTAYLHDKGALVSFAEVDHPLLLRKGIRWTVFVVQNAGEVFNPLGSFVFRMSIIGMILVVLLAFAGFVFGDMLLRPIKEVLDGIRHIEKGDLDFRVKSTKGSDEIERLASSFNEMAEKLKNASLSAAKEKDEPEKKQESLNKLRELKANFISALNQFHIDALIARPEIESVLNGKSSSPNGKDAIEVAGRDMENLIQKLDKLIEMAKMDTGKVDLDIKPFDVKDVLKDVIMLLEPKMRGKKLNLRIDMPEEDTKVYADPAKIAYVFTYLLENAINFTKEGHIEVCVKILEDTIECCVIDTGPGISKDEIHRLFEKFQRFGQDASKDEEGGLGLGLAIAKGIVEMHKGNIWAESELGKGTRIAFRLPRYKSPQPIEGH